MSYTPKEGNARIYRGRERKRAGGGCEKKGRRPAASRESEREREEKPDARRGTARETHLTDVAPHYYFADTDDSILVRCCCCTAVHGVTVTVRFLYYFLSARDSVYSRNEERKKKKRKTNVNGRPGYESKFLRP